LISENVEKCESSSLFTLEDHSEQFNQFAKDTAHYFYKWALFRDTSWVDIIEQGQSMSLAVGTHKLCNMQVAKNDFPNLPSLPLDADPESINELFQVNHMCAQMGDSCVTIVVYPSTDTLFKDTVLCVGQVLELYGESI